MKSVYKNLYFWLTIGVLAMTVMINKVQDEETRSSNLKLGSDRSVCVGRFLIDIPRSLEFSYGDTRIYGVQITSDNTESQTDFEKIILDREKELTTAEIKEDVGGLERVRDVKMTHAYGKIFHFGRVRDYHFAHGEKVYSEWFSIEGYVRIEDVSYRFFVEIGNDEKAQVVEQIIINLRGRKPDEVPEQEGFCIENGIVLGTIATKRKVESTVLFAGDPRHPDVAFALSSMSDVTQQRTLLQRIADSPTRREYRARFQTIFEGRRSINGMPGEEESHAVRELKGTRGHTFMWESDSVKDDVLKPFLSLELSTGIGRPGEPVNSSLSDKEVKALWEKISNSLRLRPISPPVSKDTPVTQPPSSASAGTPCPRSGWWSCAEHADGYEVVGGTTQYLAEGVRMPNARLLGPKKMFGRRTEFELSTPTTWKFVKERV